MPTLQLEKQNNSYNEIVDPHSGLTRGVDLMAQELSVLGYVTPELWAMIQDEEDTFAAELLPAQELAYATVPRDFYQKDDELIDKHGQRLSRVFNGGIEFIKEQLNKGVPGSDWELRRRQAELRNLETIMAMPAGTVCVEISASPFDKPENERKAQNYTDLTMIRASFKGEEDKVKENKVKQYNYVLPVSSSEFLGAVQTKLGRDSEDHIFSSEELLENPVIQTVDEPVESAAKQMDSLIGAALLEASVGHSAVQMIKRAIENRREAWQFVTSEENEDLHQELQAAMMQAALLPEFQRFEAMNAIRSGFWKELMDRFAGRQIAAKEGGIIMAAASRAVVDGNVFIACGTETVATEFTSDNASNTISRSETVRNLKEKVVGNGSCVACGAKGKLYGCGLCGGCNKKWCDIYEATGRQTDIKDLAHQNYSRPQFGLLDIKAESFSEYWQRIGREIELKKQAKKARQAETGFEESKVGLW